MIICVSNLCYFHLSSTTLSNLSCVEYIFLNRHNCNGCFRFSLLGMLSSSSILARSFGCSASLSAFFLAYWCISSCTVFMLLSWWKGQPGTYLGAFNSFVLSFFCRMFMFNLLAQPHSWIPYVHMGFNIDLYIRSLLWVDRCDLDHTMSKFNDNPTICLQVTWV